MLRSSSRDRAFAMHRAGESRIHRVIILRRERIEFVVVAARAAERDAKESLTRRADHFIERVRADLRCRDGILVADIVVRPRNEKRGADFRVRLIFPDHIAGEMLADELIERLVVVERADDVVTERPEILNDLIPLVAAALAEAHDIQPVPPPVLAVVRRREQAVDQLFDHAVARR